MGGAFVNYFNRFGRQWQVYVEAEGEYRDRAENVGEFYVRNRSGEMVPLSALTRFESRSGPEFTMRYNLYRSAQIIGSAAPGYSSAQAISALEDVFAQTMPPEMGYDYSGISFQEKKAQQGVSPSLIFGLSLLVVFLVLAALYESWSLPFSVLLSTPVAVFGAFFVLWLRRLVTGWFLPPYMVQIENDVYSQIGLVMLIGLTAKNAILIVEFAKEAHEGGQSLSDAALAAARLRLRPILMTSFAFVLGCVPLWTASGAGSVARQIMGTTVIGGMLAATLIAIFVIPALFVVVERLSRRTLTVGLVTALSSGCIAGPNYTKPMAPQPAVYRGVSPEQAVKSDPSSFGDQTWGDAFQDEALRDLIRSALTQNYDVRIAAARILQARALLGITRADQLPEVNATASAFNERFPEGAGRPAIDTSAVQVSVALGWELDFWGKFRRATESARASLLAEEWAQRQVVSSLVSGVASAYFQLREYDLELEISRQTLSSRQDSLRLTQLLADRGATSLLDVRQAEQLVFGAGATIPDLERRIEQQENFISILLGENPGAIGRGRRLVEQPRPPEVPAGLPSSLLERRPDILQAEQELVAANAQIGVAKADYFPRIALTAAGGAQSSALARLFSGPAGLWSFGASALQPVFDGSRIRNRVRFAEARAQEATLVYQRTVQQAFREVSDALVAYRKSQEFRVQQQQLTTAAEDATRLSNMRYGAGATSYLEVLDSETRVFTAQLALAQAQLRELQSLVEIYRALGGGWQP
jgi:NodT family efflux transporter outer membrane factor (OMF) lipoprotein